MKVKLPVTVIVGRTSLLLGDLDIPIDIHANETTPAPHGTVAVTVGLNVDAAGYTAVLADKLEEAARDLRAHGPRRATASTRLPSILDTLVPCVLCGYMFQVATMVMNDDEEWECDDAAACGGRAGSRPDGAAHLANGPKARRGEAAGR